MQQAITLPRPTLHFTWCILEHFRNSPLLDSHLREIIEGKCETKRTEMAKTDALRNVYHWAWIDREVGVANQHFLFNDIGNHSVDLLLRKIIKEKAYVKESWRQAPLMIWNKEALISLFNQTQSRKDNIFLKLFLHLSWFLDTYF